MENIYLHVSGSIGFDKTKNKWQLAVAVNDRNRREDRDLDCEESIIAYTLHHPSNNRGSAFQRKA